jgi:hypothetical protein
MVDSSRPRYEFTVDRIDGPFVHGHLSNGTLKIVRLVVLQKRHRACRLVRHSDGSAAGSSPADSDGRDLDPTASDFVQTYQPRGLVREIPRHTQALAMKRQGMSVEQIADYFKKTEGAVKAWLVRARAAEQDTKFMKAR